MARDFTKNASNTMSLGTNALGPLINGARAISFGAIVKFDTLQAAASTNDRMLSGFIASNNGLLLALNGSSSLLSVGGRSVTGEGFESSLTFSVSANVEYHLGGVLDFTGDAIRSYVDGVEQADDAKTFDNSTYTNGTPSVQDMIGASNQAPSTAHQVDGQISEVFLYKGDIGAEGFAQLGDRISPEMVRRELLVAYWPLLGNATPEIERINRKVGTISGTIAKAAHPRIIYPRRRSVFLVETAVAGRVMSSLVGAGGLAGGGGIAGQGGGLVA